MPYSRAEVTYGNSKEFAMKTGFLLLFLGSSLLPNPLFSMATQQITPKKTLFSLQEVCLTALKKSPHIKKEIINFSYHQKATLHDVIYLQYIKKDFKELYAILSHFNLCDIKARVQYFESIQQQSTASNAVHVP